MRAPGFAVLPFVVTAVTLLVAYFGAVAGYVAWAAVAAAHGTRLGSLIAGAPAIYIAFYLLCAGFSFALAWIYRTPRPPECRIGARATMRLYLGEAIAMAKSHPRMAFAWWGMRDPPPRPGGAPVLLLHGVLCNAGMWRGVLPRIAAAGSPVYTLSYGPPQASIETFVEQLAAKIATIRAATGATKMTLVAHSMGGLIVRAYMRRYGAAHVRCLVAIGTPHHGSVHARLVPASASRRYGRAACGSPSSIATSARGRRCASCRSGRGTTRWSRRRRARASKAPRTLPSSVWGITR
jgi:hypothetical protein